MPFETPRAVNVADLRDRKITCANEILRQTTELKQIEFPRKLKLIYSSKKYSFPQAFTGKLQRYDQLQLRGAAMRAVIEPRDASFGAILGIVEGYMGVVGPGPKSAPLPATS